MLSYMVSALGSLKNPCLAMCLLYKTYLLIVSVGYKLSFLPNYEVVNLATQFK